MHKFYKIFKILLPLSFIFSFLFFSLINRVPYDMDELELTELYSNLSEIDREESNQTIEYWTNLEKMISISYLTKTGLMDRSSLKDKKQLIKIWEKYQNTSIDILSSEEKNFLEEIESEDNSFLLDELVSPFGNDDALQISKRFGYDENKVHHNGIDQPQRSINLETGL